MTHTHTRTPPFIGLSICFLYTAPPLPPWLPSHTVYKDLIVHTSVMISTEAVRCCDPFSFSALQAHKLKRHAAFFPIVRLSSVRIQTHAVLPVNKLVFVLSDHKYCFGKVVFIKIWDRVY